MLLSFYRIAQGAYLALRSGSLGNRRMPMRGIAERAAFKIVTTQKLGCAGVLKRAPRGQFNSIAAGIFVGAADF